MVVVDDGAADAVLDVAGARVDDVDLDSDPSAEPLQPATSSAIPAAAAARTNDVAVTSVPSKNPTCTKLRQYRQPAPGTSGSRP